MPLYSGLSEAQIERLALLVEELGEAQQMIGKILRHGYMSTHPNGGPTNRAALLKELGDVAYAITLMGEAGDFGKLHEIGLLHSVVSKSQKIGVYLHHQSDVVLSAVNDRILEEAGKWGQR